MRTANEVAVFGAGAWGTALALALSYDGIPVTLWARDAAQADAMQKSGENRLRLPGFSIESITHVTSDLADAAQAKIWLLAVPAQELRRFCRCLPPSTAIAVLCAKGFERGTGKLLSQVWNEERPGQPLAVLSGPSFADEVAAGKPTALTLAAAARLGPSLSAAIGTRILRLYWTTDVIGTELGGAVKNVLAIAAGILTGRHLGENARAAMLTRGLAEMTRLGMALDAKAETFAGLSGLGDLILTATSLRSRNMQLGYRIGLGMVELPLALENAQPLAEGVATATACRLLASHHQLDLPILTAVDHILSGRFGVAEMIDQILSRPLHAEKE